MTKRLPFPLALLLCSVVLLAGCSRQELFDRAITWERNSAGLSPHQVTVGDLNIAYLSNTDANDGEVLVMIHGFAANKDNWVRMAANLTGRYQVYAIDLPGHGDSSKDLDLGYSLPEQVAYLNRILDTLGLDHINLIGNSMGGAIAALYTARYPDQVQTTTLFNPAGVFKYESELFALVNDGTNPLIVSKSGDMERLVDFALEQKPFVPWPIYDVMEEKALQNQPVNEQIFQTLRQTGNEEAFRKALQVVSTPVLVIWGDHDRVINYRNSEVFLEDIPGASAIILEGVGHAPMIEVPERAATLVQEFIDSSNKSGQQQP